MQNVGVMTNSRRGKTKEIEGKLIVGAAGRNARSTTARNSASYGSLQWCGQECPHLLQFAFILQFA